jgi:hypothetical protein
MTVITHQAMGMTQPVEPGNNGMEHVKKQQPIIVITEDRTAGIPTVTRYTAPGYSIHSGRDMNAGYNG